MQHNWFDCKVENKEGSIHTTHGVCFLEKLDETVERNFDDVQLPRTGKRSLIAEKQHLPVAKIVPHKLPSSFGDTKSGMYSKGGMFADYSTHMENATPFKSRKSNYVVPICGMGNINL